jgi:predicted phage terminase large subunit-like protein
VSSAAIQAGAELELRRRRDRPLREYVDHATRSRFRWYRHNEALDDVLQRVVDGEIKRLMVFEPPRHGKTEQVSRLLPGKWLERYPDTWVGLTSYGATLAQSLSRSAREYYRAAGGALAKDRQSVSEWETGKRGGLWAAGVGGGITGKGFHLGIIDDPVKDRAEADSVTYRDALREWYTSTFYTRREPDAAIVIVLTRWHHVDLAGWLLDREGSEDPERWHIVDLPARAEAERPEYPDTCTVEPDWREPGEPLCPERYDDASLRHTEANAGPRDWASLYQQRPRPREGGFFKYAWFGEDRYARPSGGEWVRYWDTAGTDGGGDYTVGVLMGRAPDGLFYVADVVRGQWSPGRRDEVIRQTAEKDGHDVRIWLEQEAGVSGKERSQATVRKLAGYTVRTEPVTGSKEDRADPFAAQSEVGNVRLCRGTWNREYIEELVSFPNGDHDDQVDGSSGAFNKLAVHSEAESVFTPFV